ncbi:hypothetical protein BBUWI9123_E0031 (plasmid) [Borreliella burgdorferi WI91-23]|nr:hypothetical protein BBUWI9123_E0031 [Borreliella burgdorferi WI91-23]
MLQQDFYRQIIFFILLPLEFYRDVLFQIDAVNQAMYFPFV